jgi:K+-transporting ATPase A subunit
LVPAIQILVLALSFNSAVMFGPVADHLQSRFH